MTMLFKQCWSVSFRDPDLSAVLFYCRQAFRLIEDINQRLLLDK